MIGSRTYGKCPWRSCRPHVPRCRRPARPHEGPREAMTRGRATISRAAHAQTAGHLTGSEERGGCNSLGRLDAGSTWPDLAVIVQEQNPSTPRSRSECDSRSPLSPSAHARAHVERGPPLRSSEEGAPHERGPGSSTLPAATGSLAEPPIPECSNSRIRGFEPLGWGCNSLLRSLETTRRPAYHEAGHEPGDDSQRPPTVTSRSHAGLAHLVMTPASRAGTGEFDPLAPYRCPPAPAATCSGRAVRTSAYGSQTANGRGPGRYPVRTARYGVRVA